MFHAVIEPGEERGLVVSFPDVPEAITQGDDHEDALITINAEIGVHESGASIHLFLDGERVNRIGPYENWDTADEAACILIATLKQEDVMPWVSKVTADDLRELSKTRKPAP